MTSRERIQCAIELGTPDRVPVVPWGFGRVPEDSELGRRLLHECDPFIGARVLGGDWFLGTAVKTRTEERDGKTYSVIEAPRGDLSSRYQRTEITGAHMEFFCKSADDVHNLLSIPYEPPVIDVSPFIETKDRIVEEGMVGVRLTNPGGIPARYLSPADYSLMWLDDRDTFMELCRVAAERCYHLVDQCCRQGVDCFRIIGGEVASTQLGPEFRRPSALRQADGRIMHEHGALALLQPRADGPLPRNDRADRVDHSTRWKVRRGRHDACTVQRADRRSRSACSATSMTWRSSAKSTARRSSSSPRSASRPQALTATCSAATRHHRTRAENFIGWWT